MHDFSIKFLNRTLHYHAISQSNWVFDSGGRVIICEFVEKYIFCSELARDLDVEQEKKGKLKLTNVKTSSGNRSTIIVKR
jgi:hypothetical protein